MSERLRPFLVVVLVLLQIAAPLVHAHAGGNRQQRGLHLHEFEVFSHVGNDSNLMSASASFDNDSAVIVDIDSAIKHSQHQHNDQTMTLDCQRNHVSFAIEPLAAIINFSPHTLAHIPAFAISNHSSRAPPF